MTTEPTLPAKLREQAALYRRTAQEFRERGQYAMASWFDSEAESRERDAKKWEASR